MNTDEALRLAVAAVDVAYTLPAGHRVRVHVTSSSFPRLERAASAIQHIFQYSRTNSAYAVPYWDAASGANSMLFDSVSLRGEFIKR